MRIWDKTKALFGFKPAEQSVAASPEEVAEATTALQDEKASLWRSELDAAVQPEIAGDAGVPQASTLTTHDHGGEHRTGDSRTWWRQAQD